MKEICGQVFRDAMGKAFEWLTGPDAGLLIICGKSPNHKGKHATDDGMYEWDS